MAVLLPPTAPGAVFAVSVLDPIGPETIKSVLRSPRVSTDPVAARIVPTTGQLYPRGDN